MVRGRQIALARELQVMGRSQGEIAERLGVASCDLDLALWRAIGFKSKALRSYWARANFSTFPVYAPMTDDRR